MKFKMSLMLIFLFCFLSSGPLTKTVYSEEPEIQTITVLGIENLIKENEGKVVLVNFWATWCGYCIEEIPDLVSLQNEYDRKLKVIGVSFDLVSNYYKGFNGGDVSGWVTQCMKDNDINYDVYLAESKDLYDHYNIPGLPVIIIYDLKGDLYSKYIGYGPKESLIKSINKLIGMNE